MHVHWPLYRLAAAWTWVREAFDDGWVGVPREDPLRVRPWCARAFLHLTIAIRAWVRRMCACAHARVRRVKCQEEARLHVGSVRRPRTRLLLRLQQRTLTRDWRERGRALVRGLGRLVRRLRLRLRVRPGLRRCPGEPLPQLRAGRAGRRRRRVGARVRRQMQLAWPGLGLGLGLGLGFGLGIGLGIGMGLGMGLGLGLGRGLHVGHVVRVSPSRVVGLAGLEGELVAHQVVLLQCLLLRLLVVGARVEGRGQRR